ncbi:chemotaxis protein CheB [Desulfurivibrio alkaliphilus]|uniref:protein-glutamate methylesterase n=1 Tax=Desulfurivibrio alkaliphilus (strain DSM 19089 / UNIQEM U267 / AHT2) TaxID=589865 RepID=D6Z3A1_DESAT|nr:chemotaxis protein CheB [Desulfurivibrio alkaliphilus]ADH86026.1 CheB methylesterase [Desulfurivibrio alkaliphilus AHT 2]
MATKKSEVTGRQVPPYRAVVIGVSAGGMEALREILSRLPADFPLPLLVVQHLGGDADDYLARWLDQRCAIRVKEAEDKESAVAGTAYLAPANYHLLVEDDGSLALSLEDWVNFSRPSIDLLFETAAEVHGAGLIAVVLTGANDDGSRGLAAVKRRGGLAVVQDPAGAEFPTMPRAAIQAAEVDFVLPLPAIGRFLANLYRPA